MVCINICQTIECFDLNMLKRMYDSMACGSYLKEKFGNRIIETLFAYSCGGLHIHMKHTSYPI